MESNRFAQAFARLPTSDSRRNALQALVHELTPYEWRFVQSLTTARTFQFDIVGQLPLELVAQIFSHLDTTAPWRLQLISKAWLRNLRNTAVLKASLDSWYDGTVNLQGADVDFYRRKARSVHAFRHSSRSSPPDSCFRISTAIKYAHLLVGDNLIWTDADWSQNIRQVRLFNMRSWSFRVLQGEARELIRNVCASDEIVVFTTQSTAYVAKLNSDDAVKKFRVVNPSMLSTVTCRERTVACAGYLQGSLLVYIWNFDTQQGTSFNISYEDAFPGRQLNSATLQPGLALLLQPATETIVLVTFEHGRMNDPYYNDPPNESLSEPSAVECPKIMYSRITYAGECIHAAEQVLDEFDHYVLALGDKRDFRFIPTSHNGLFALQVQGWRVAQFARIIPLLQFDEQLNAFTSPGYPGPKSLRLHRPGRSVRRSNDEAYSRVLWWKDTFIEATSKKPAVIHRGTSSVARHEILLTMECPELDPEVAGDNICLFINDMYIVRPYGDAFYICCFDHTVRLPEKEGRLGEWGSWERIETSLVHKSNMKE